MILHMQGNPREFEDGLSIADIAGKISNGLKKKALGAKVNDQLVGLDFQPQDGDSVTIVTFEDEEGRHIYRHTASHILAQAVKHLFPEARLAIGPAIDNGFYYDFDVENPFTTEDLAKLEKEAAKIIKQNHKIERFELPRAEAIAKMKAAGEPYKVELIEDLPEDAVISFYSQGDFTDLCAGPHLPSTGKVKAFKLTHVAGAYWRGDEKNKMLQRIYGTAFDTREALDEYLALLEEAKKRDHRKLGRELDLFSLHEEGPGFPFFHPKGMILRNELENYWRKMHTEAGYEEIKTPIMLNRALWERSGHWDHYRENMYTSVIDEMDYAIKPMNCPGGMIVYNRRIWSYRDLPVRMGELGLVHRHELSGALHGLMRVRNFTQDDAHLYITPEQIVDELVGVIELTDRIYSTFGFKYRVELSTRPENSFGTEEQWEQATEGLRSALEAKGMDYVVNEGDGAFYGPKIDFHLEDSLGRTWQCGTIQLDYQMPERFDLTYVGADGEKHRPVMIHRTIFGSLERFIGILIEHYAGAFPTWLAPVQVKVLTITDRANEAADEIVRELRALDIRAEADKRNEKIGYKIRETQAEKIPYVLILGDKEVENGEVALRARGLGDVGALPRKTVYDMVLENIASKSNEIKA